MGHFDIDVKSLTDASSMAQQATREIHKDIDAVTQGKPLTTSASENKSGNPQNMTVYSVAQILQGVPAYTSPTETLGQYSSLVSSSMLLPKKDGGDSLADHLRTGLIPDDVKKSLNSLEAADRYTKTGDAYGTTGAADGSTPDAGSATDGSGGADGTSPAAGDVTIDQILSHPNIKSVTANFKDYAAKNQIHPSVMWVCKFLADNGCTLFIISGFRPGAVIESGSNAGQPSLHAKGYAVDIRPIGGDTDLTGNPWNDKVFQLLDSLTGDKRPTEVGGPYIYQGGKGISWFDRPDHKNHIHIGYKNAPIQTVTSSGTTGTSTANQQVSFGAPIANIKLSTRLPNQNAVVIPNETQLDLMRRCLVVVKGIMEADPTVQNKLQMYVALIESGWPESHWTNIDHGDASSVGIFQLLSSNGGSSDPATNKANRMNPEFCANWWGQGARGAPAKNGKGTAGDVAWQTEKPAAKYRYRYDTYRNQAVSDLALLGIDASSIDA